MLKHDFNLSPFWSCTQTKLCPETKGHGVTPPISGTNSTFPLSTCMTKRGRVKVSTVSENFLTKTLLWCLGCLCTYMTTALTGLDTTQVGLMETKNLHPLKQHCQRVPPVPSPRTEAGQAASLKQSELLWRRADSSPGFCWAHLHGLPTPLRQSPACAKESSIAPLCAALPSSPAFRLSVGLPAHDLIRPADHHPAKHLPSPRLPSSYLWPRF